MDYNKLYNDIPKSDKIMMDELYKLEGGVLHRNPNENDITNGYGIYKYIHPDEEVWTYYDNIAKLVGITSKSNKWTRVELRLINDKVDKMTEKYLSYLFYKEYFSNAHLDSYHPVLIPIVISIYTNSIKLYNKALQRSINKCINSGIMKGRLLNVDGVVGKNTLNYISKTLTLDNDSIYKFKSILLEEIREGYRTLVNRNPSKYGMYLTGWLNRVNALV